MTLSTSEQLHNFVDDLGRTLETAVPALPECTDVVLCGMGGSAITADVVADLCFPCSRVPITVVKCPVLPSWVGEGTLAVVSSYSGNTAETIEMYRRARDAGCTVVAITSGGILKDLAEEDGTVLMLLPDGLHPRHSIGYMIGYTLAVMRPYGCSCISDVIASMLPSLREYRDMLEGKGSIAYEMAGEYLDHVPVIGSDACLRSVAFRWKTQFNENSKYVAFCGTVPDFRYGALGSWIDGGRDNFSLTFLVGSDASDSLKAVMDSLDDGGCAYRRVDLGGSSPAEDLFRALMLGDYISIYMADMRGIDSAEVKPVQLMKKRLADRP